ncbi:MAG: permease prefix domain 1-containing protein [Spirochaetaceae bacterium]|jgi:MFS family permease|nr:permease prefix domain 1-containing protein [Spirochaetaceae bacterium]
MDTKEHIQSLFKDYEETPELRDFMEELQSNMEARVASLVKKGLAGGDAFAKAAAELGDISALADKMSRKRRQEVFEDAYLGLRKYLNPLRVAGYVVFGATLAAGIIIALIVYFSAGGRFLAGSFALETGAFTAALGAFLWFFVISVMGLSYLGLTQETSSRYPLRKKRALWYAFGAGASAASIVLFPLSYFAVLGTGKIGSYEAFVPALGTALCFLLPGIALLVFLGLTERKTLKSWALERYASEFEQALGPDGASRFGLLSGAIWTAAFGFFFALGFALGFRFSWLSFVFAVALQLFTQALLYRSVKNKKPTEN